jgi:hypothetical protein
MGRVKAVRERERERKMVVWVGGQIDKRSGEGFVKRADKSVE